MGGSQINPSRMSFFGGNGLISACGTNDRHNLVKFPGEKVRGVEKNENIMLQKQADFEAEVRFG